MTEQKNGHIRIPNDVWEALIKYHIPGQEMQCLMYIIRKTIGWSKTSDEIALSQFIDFTMITKSSVCRAISKLKQRNLIFVDKKVNRTHSTYQFNMKYKSWEALTKMSIVDKNVNESLTKKRHTINTRTINTRKENKEKKIFIEKCFTRFYSAYPKKVGKVQALKTWEKLTLAKKLPPMFILIQKIKAQKKSSQWQNKKYIPNPSTWLNNGGWDDEVIIDKKKIQTRDFTKNKRKNKTYKAAKHYKF